MVLLAALAFCLFVCFGFAVGLLECAVHCSDPVCNPEGESDQQPGSTGAKVSVEPDADVTWQQHSQHYL